MDNERNKQLGKIIAVSRDMLVLAQKNEWERVAELDDQRRTLVMHCFRSPTPEQDASAVAALIREILSLNQQVTDLGKAYRQSLGDKLHTNRVGRTAQVAYLGCAR